jgi:hypothetical protein
MILDQLDKAASQDYVTRFFKNYYSIVIYPVDNIPI